METEEQDLRGLLQRVISERLVGATILDVQVEREKDAEGDDVLAVTVIFEAPRDLDAARVAGLVRHLRPYLRERGETGFPLMSFLSPKEAKRLGFAAG